MVHYCANCGDYGNYEFKLEPNRLVYTSGEYYIRGHTNHKILCKRCFIARIDCGILSKLSEYQGNEVQTRSF